jgi:twitching motility two-component system response regulator PilG
MTTNINVGILGFSAEEERKLNKIFKLSQQYDRSYQRSDMASSEAVQLLLVKKTVTFNPQQQVPVVMVGKEPAANNEFYYIRGVLLPSRVLPILDKVELSPFIDNSDSAVEQTVIAENNHLSILNSTATAADLQVLVVDDSVMMQKTVQLELDKATIPLAVDFADSGEIALEKVKQKKYDFIFLDVMMPGIDGFETCSQIRKLEGMAKTPIIMLTSKTSALDEVKGLMAGCTTYLTKPFVHDEFHKMLERIMHWVKEFNEKK